MSLLDAEGYEVETEEGPMFVRPLERLVSEEKSLRAMGVDNICPRCNGHCAMMFGDPDGDHWCLVCQICEEAEKLVEK